MWASRPRCFLFVCLALLGAGLVESRRIYTSLSDATNQECSPEELEESQRCQYVLSHRQECAPRAGMLNYLVIYYCWDLQYWDSIAVLLTLLWIVFLFMMMFITSDRFFCPALELISEYLRLSPAVAGATLLSFGNGAPDVFTQISAMQAGMRTGQGVSPEAVSMALSEPLGTGLFVGNVVLALSVAAAQSMHEVVLSKLSFMKDVTFYMFALGMVFASMLIGTVYMWQAFVLLGAYVLYVLCTIALSLNVERVHLDPLQHEVPRLVPYGPWDDLDSDEVENWDWLEALPSELRTDSLHHSIINVHRHHDSTGAVLSWRERVSVLAGRDGPWVSGRSQGELQPSAPWAVRQGIASLRGRNHSMGAEPASGRRLLTTSLSAGTKRVLITPRLMKAAGSAAGLLRPSLRSASALEPGTWDVVPWGRHTSRFLPLSSDGTAPKASGSRGRTSDVGPARPWRNDETSRERAGSGGEGGLAMDDCGIPVGSAPAARLDMLGVDRQNPSHHRHTRSLEQEGSDTMLGLAEGAEEEEEEEQSQHTRLDRRRSLSVPQDEARLLDVDDGNGVGDSMDTAFAMGLLGARSSQALGEASHDADDGWQEGVPRPANYVPRAQGEDQAGPTSAESSGAPSADPSNRFARMPSMRQAQGLATLARNVSLRFRYSSETGHDSQTDVDSPGPGGASPGGLKGGSPPSGLKGGSPPPGLKSPGLRKWEGPSEEVYVPLLLQGKLQELEAALKEHEVQRVSSQGLESMGSGAMWSGASAEVGGGSGGGSASTRGGGPGPTLSNKELQSEQKRLKKMLYYGHRQAQKERDASNHSMASIASAGSEQSDGGAGTKPQLSRSGSAHALDMSAVGGAVHPIQEDPVAGAAPGYFRNSSAASFGEWAASQPGSSGATSFGRLLRGTSASRSSLAFQGSGELTTPLLEEGDRGREDGGESGRGGITWAAGVAVHDGPKGAWAGGVLENVSEELYAELDEQAEVALRTRQHRLVESRMRWHWIVWRTLRRPLVFMLSLTMPRMERSQELHWPKPFAVAAPLVGPLLIGWVGGWLPLASQAGREDTLQPPAIASISLACVLLSVSIILHYPQDGILHGKLLGVCTVLTFLFSMQWMNMLADELVGLLVAVGHVMNLPPALLGATVLAWGNALSDLVSNTTLARDGYPTMALTACFASPLFILLAGVACTLTFGAADTGSMAMPQDKPTMALYATSIVNMIMWAIVVPCFRFRLDRRITVLGLLFYACFQVGFVFLILEDKVDDGSDA